MPPSLGRARGKSYFLVDTKTTCFLCLQKITPASKDPPPPPSIYLKSEDQDDSGNGMETQEEEDDQEKKAEENSKSRLLNFVPNEMKIEDCVEKRKHGCLRTVFKYLNIDPGEVIRRELQGNQESFLISIGGQLENNDLLVKLCEECSKVVQMLSDLCYQLEMLQRKVNHSLGTFLEVLRKSEDDPVLLTNFQSQIEDPSPSAVMQASVAELMRKETYKKGYMKLNKSIPSESVTDEAVPKFSTNLKTHKSRHHTTSANKIGHFRLHYFQRRAPKILRKRQVLFPNRQNKIVRDTARRRHKYKSSAPDFLKEVDNKLLSPTPQLSPLPPPPASPIPQLSRTVSPSLEQDSKRLDCHICGFKFTKSGNLMRHLELKTCVKKTTRGGDGVDDEVPPVVDPPGSKMCRFCGKVFCNSSTRRIHQQLNCTEAKAAALARLSSGDDGDEDGAYQQSPYFLPTSSHPATETDEGEANFSQEIPSRQFECHICGFRFSLRYSLIRHLKLKTCVKKGEDGPEDNFGDTKRSASCRYCGKYFSSSSTRRVHQKLHCAEAKAATLAHQSLEGGGGNFIREENQTSNDSLVVTPSFSLTDYYGVGTGDGNVMEEEEYENEVYPNAYLSAKLEILEAPEVKNFKRNTRKE